MPAPLPYTNALVIGAGSWGTALTAVLAERGLQVQFWGRDPALMDEIQATRRNSRYLPGLVLPPSIHATADASEIKPADLAVFVVPSKAVRETAASMATLPALQSVRVIISCAKGIEIDSGKRLTQILAESFASTPLAVLTGPNHAEEVSQRMATAAVVACEKEDIAREVQGCFTLPWLRSYTSDDVTGVEWAGAMKNPYAIAAGIALGLKLGDNAIAALVTRALAEMVRMGIAMGGRAESFMGLGGVGDLMATCYSEHSRNHRVGRLIGEGMPLQEIMSSTRMVAEGVPNTASLHRAAKTKGVRTPLLDEIHAILYEEKPAKDAMRALLSRDPRAENE